MPAHAGMTCRAKMQAASWRAVFSNQSPEINRGLQWPEMPILRATRVTSRGGIMEEKALDETQMNTIGRDK